jgi:hypothetical protein
MILVSGCSFLHHAKETLEERLGNHENWARSGAGNEYIAASIISAVRRDPTKYKYAFILWSGIDRIDLSMPTDLSEIYVPSYSYKKQIDHRSYIFSGGIGASYRSLPPSPYSKYVDLLYKTDEYDYFTDQTITAMFTVASVLDAYNIPYDFGSIYDPLAKYDPPQAVLGSSTMSEIVDYYSIKTYPFNECNANGMLQSDNFHPTSEGLRQWIKSVKLKIDDL